MTWLLWFIIAVMFGIIEIITVGFFMIWFGVGALAAMLVSLLFNNIIIEVSVFTIVSIILLFMTRKFTSKVTQGRGIATNIDAIIGKVGIVLEDINPLDSPGIVKVSGEIWSAISADTKVITKGTKIEVLEVQGVKLVVEEIE